MAIASPATRRGAGRSRLATFIRSSSQTCSRGRDNFAPRRCRSIMSQQFQFTRLQDGKKQRLATLADAIGMTKTGARETWLFVSPHDDDLVIGAGLWMQAAVQADVDVQVLVVTDGRMGYCTLEQRG